MKNKVLVAILAAAVIAAVAIYMIFDKEAKVGVGENTQTSSDSSVYISEVMASNGGYVPNVHGEFYDWVELYNSGDKEINVSSWALSDNRDQGKWTFPTNSVIPAKSYIIVYCSGLENNIEGELHASFRIKNGAEAVYLLNSSGRIVDTAPANTVPKGQTYARIDQSDEFVSSLPTPMFANDETGRAGFLDSMKIPTTTGVILSEIQPSNISTLMDESGNYPDWIELTNADNKPVDISGFGLSDDELRPLKWKFSEGTVLMPGEYLIVYADGNVDTTSNASSDLNPDLIADNKNNRTELHASFKLESYTGALYFSNNSGKIINYIEYEDVLPDNSYSLVGDDWKQSVKPTPGLENTAKSEAEFDQILSSRYNSDVYISEVMMTNSSYLDDEGYFDWIELHNSSDKTVDISGYGLGKNTRNPLRWRIPQNTEIEPGRYLVIEAVGFDEAKKKSNLADKTQIKYIYTDFALNNIDGEIIALWDTELKMIDRISVDTLYNDSSAGRDNTASANRATRIFLEPTPGLANNVSHARYAQSAEINLVGGLYSGEQKVNAKTIENNASIKYTIDGSEPIITSKELESDVILDKTAVLRVRVFSDDNSILPSVTTTQSYIINSEHDPRLSIVSLATDNDLLYNEDYGIYARGKNAEIEVPYRGANFWNEWEVPANVEIFAPENSGGEQQIDQDIAIRIFGDYSRAKDQKGFSLIPRSMYGSKSFDFNVFENRPFDEYRSLILRAGAQDSTVTKVHDIVATGLVDGTTNLKVQAYRQGVLYLNGNYFGIYNIREKINRFWISQHYDLNDVNNIDLLVGNGTAISGSRTEYDKLVEYCKKHDLSKQEYYEYISDKIDIENYIDYLICEMFVANTDTGNIKYFRAGSDEKGYSKWRWIYYDFCWSFINTKLDSFAFLTNPDGHGAGNAYSTQLNRSLFQNSEFRSQFLRRSAELLNTIYTPENVLAKIDECEDIFIEEMRRDIKKWPEEGRGGYEAWESNMEHMKFFAQNRRDYMIGFLREHFDLNENQAIAIFGDAGVIVEKTQEPTTSQTHTDDHENE